MGGTGCFGELGGSPNPPALVLQHGAGPAKQRHPPGLTNQALPTSLHPSQEAQPKLVAGGEPHHSPPHLPSVNPGGWIASDRAMRWGRRMQPGATPGSSVYSQTEGSTCPSRLSYGCCGSCNLACCAFKNLHPHAALMEGFSAVPFLLLAQAV